MNAGGPLPVSFADTLAFEWVRNKIIVPVVVNGKPYRFILDTGAPLIVSDVLEDIWNAEAQTPVTLRDQSGKKQDSVRLIRSGKLKLGHTEYEGVPALVMDRDNPVFRCMNIDGFIGSNLLRQSVLGIDLPARRVYIHNHSEWLPGKRYRMPMKLDAQSNPFFRLRIGKGHTDVLFDSGSDKFFEMSYSLTDAWQARARGRLSVLRKGYGISAMGFAGVEAPAPRLQLMATGLQIGEAVFDTAFISTTTSAESRAGAALLHYGRITLDYRRQYFYFEPSGVPLRHRDSLWSFSLLPLDTAVVIGAIWDQDLAAQYDIHLYDPVLMLNNRPVKGLTLCDFMSGIFPPSCTAVPAQVQGRDGRVRQLIMEKK